MPEYHVGLGLAGIYAGTLKKNGEEWINKSDVTMLIDIALSVATIADALTEKGDNDDTD